MTTTPIFDAVKQAQQWSPDELSEPYDIDAAIAASYARRRELHKLHGAMTRARDARGRFVKDSDELWGCW